MNRVASYVGSRVAKVLAGARRANNYNAALVGELKRWNRKLEVDIALPLSYPRPYKTLASGVPKAQSLWRVAMC